jgi:hypothetical protein
VPPAAAGGVPLPPPLPPLPPPPPGAWAGGVTPCCFRQAMIADRPLLEPLAAAVEPALELVLVAVLVAALLPQAARVQLVATAASMREARRARPGANLVVFTSVSFSVSEVQDVGPGSPSAAG